MQIPRALALIAPFCWVQSMNFQQTAQVTHTLKSLDHALINDALVWPECTSPPKQGVDFEASIGRPLGIRSVTSCLQHRENGDKPEVSQPVHERVKKVIKLFKAKEAFFAPRSKIK